MENLETRCCSHVAQTRQASYYCSEEVLSKTGSYTDTMPCRHEQEEQMYNTR